MNQTKDKNIQLIRCPSSSKCIINNAHLAKYNMIHDMPEVGYVCRGLAAIPHRPTH